MRINSICFHPLKEQVGGSQIPAYAFQAWCDILKVDCDIDTVINNNCDWMFLSTAGTINDPDIGEITVPFAMMIHAEFDANIYPEADNLLNHELCKLVVVIGEGYWITKQTQLYWHPCTLPYYLMTEDTEFETSNRYGLLYAARISSWKGINKLAALSQYRHFFDSVDHRIDIYGKQSSHFVLERGRYNLKNESYNIYDFEKMGQLYSRYKYIWDVSGTAEYKMPIKRLNLAAVEAMKFGCIPIADPDTCYPFVKKWIVDLSQGFPYDFKVSQDLMKEEVLKSPICYDSVKKQVENIIDFMEKFT